MVDMCLADDAYHGMRQIHHLHFNWTYIHPLLDLPLPMAFKIKNQM